MIGHDKGNLKRSARREGFHVIGDFLIGSHSNDVVSGLVLDSPPSSIYIWTFLLPTFDCLLFLHMSLGERIAACDIDDRCLEKSITMYRGSISNIKSAEDLMIHLESNNSPYAVWAKYLCLIRMRDFVRAESYRQVVSESVRSKAVSDRLKSITDTQRSGGWEAAFSLLADWSQVTSKLLPRRSVAIIRDVPG